MLVAEDDRAKRAFNAREGKFQWKVMPFGLCNVPASFQTFMNRILRPFIGKFVVVYLDDIVVYFESLEDHIQHCHGNQLPYLVGDHTRTTCVPHR